MLSSVTFPSCRAAPMSMRTMTISSSVPSPNSFQFRIDERANSRAHSGSMQACLELTFKQFSWPLPQASQRFKLLLAAYIPFAYRLPLTACRKCASFFMKLSPLASKVSPFGSKMPPFVSKMSPCGKAYRCRLAVRLTVTACRYSGNYKQPCSLPYPSLNHLSTFSVQDNFSSLVLKCTIAQLLLKSSRLPTTGSSTRPMSNFSKKHRTWGGHSFKTFHKNSDDEEGFFEKV